MAEKREFHIGDVLSITGEALVSPRGIEGVYDILNFMTQDQLFTHQLIRARDECRPALLRQHPFLAEIDDSSVNRDNWAVWLHDVVTKHGATLEIERLPDEAHEFRHPIEEAETIFGKDRVIAIATDPTSGNANG